MSATVRLVAAGVVTPEAVDQALRDGLGRRWAFMGPFEVGDLNAPQGLGDYLRRFRPTIRAIDATSAEQPLELDESLIDALDADARARLQRPREQRIADKVVIGHDVWIGHGAILLPGVTIGVGHGQMDAAELEKMQAELAGLDPNALPEDLKDMMKGGSLPSMPGLPGLGAGKLPGLGNLPGLGGNSPFKGLPGFGKKK
mgnify:CR=1 FL=1